jgi:hypothetical protein
MDEPLSPAVQAVLDAVIALYSDQQQIRDWGWQLDAPTVAAALRAAADQVVPLSYEDVWIDGRMLQFEKHDPVREKFLAIAAELEAANE